MRSRGRSTRRISSKTSSRSISASSFSTHRVDEFARDAAHAVGRCPGQRRRVRGVGAARPLSDVQQAARRLFDIARIDTPARQRRRPRDADATTPPVRLAEPGAATDRCAGSRDRADFAQRRRGCGGAERSRTDDIRTIAARAIAIRDDLKILLAADDPALRALRRERAAAACSCAPRRSTSSALIRHAIIVGSRRATVLTSATLDRRRIVRVRRRRGSAPRTRSRCGCRPSSISATQAVLYLPPDMPDPRSPEFNARPPRG